MDESSIPYGRQSIGEAEIEAVRAALRSDRITQGPRVEAFERGVADFCKVAHAVAVANGTAALELAYRAAGVGPGDEVVVPPLTFLATASAVIRCGGIPVFADVAEEDGCLDPERASEKIGPKTRVVAGVDFAGHPCDWVGLRDAVSGSGVVLVDDAAHALGAEIEGVPLGSQADLTTLSFHPVKGITTGEGGMVLTGNSDRARAVREARHHGIVYEPERFRNAEEDQGPWYHEMHEPGTNARITDLQCAIGIEQMKRLPGFLARRREIVDLYREALGDLPDVRLPEDSSRGISAWHLYVVRVPPERRRAIFEGMRTRGIGVQVHYIPVHLQPYFQEWFGTKRGDFPIAERFYDSCMSLPLFPGMVDADVGRVADALRASLRR